jgi:hypothetical protein
MRSFTQVFPDLDTLLQLEPEDIGPLILAENPDLTEELDGR